MKKLILVAAAVAALAGCASQSELNAMTPEEREEYWSRVGVLTSTLNVFGKVGEAIGDAAPPPPRMTNCTRTISGMNCTTY